MSPAFFFLMKEGSYKEIPLILWLITPTTQTTLREAPIRTNLKVEEAQILEAEVVVVETITTIVDLSANYVER